MATILRARDLTPDELAGLLAAPRFPDGQKVRAWLDGVDGWSLAYWPGIDGSVLWYSAGRTPVEPHREQAGRRPMVRRFPWNARPPVSSNR